MRKTALDLFKASCLLSCILFAVAAKFVLADVPPTSSFSGSVESGGPIVDGLQLTASVPKTNFVVGEQILLKVVATYTPDIASEGHPVNSFARWATFHISVKDAKGKDVPRTAWGKELAAQQAKESPYGIVTQIPNPVMPNGRSGWVQFIVNREFDMSQGGVYLITVDHVLTKGERKNRLVSNIVTDVTQTSKIPSNIDFRDRPKCSCKHRLLDGPTPTSA